MSSKHQEPLPQAEFQAVSHGPGQPANTDRAGRSRLRSKWKRLLPVGCLGLAAIIALFAGAVMLLVTTVMKSSDVYKTAMQRARDNPQVRSALGTPIKPGWLLTGTIKTSGARGYARLRIPISGPKAEGTLLAVATKAHGRWRILVLHVAVAQAGLRINLLRRPGSR